MKKFQFAKFWLMWSDVFICVKRIVIPWRLAEFQIGLNKQSFRLVLTVVEDMVTNFLWMYVKCNYDIIKIQEGLLLSTTMSILAWFGWLLQCLSMYEYTYIFLGVFTVGNFVKIVKILVFSQPCLIGCFSKGPQPMFVNFTQELSSKFTLISTLKHQKRKYLNLKIL